MLQTDTYWTVLRTVMKSRNLRGLALALDDEQEKLWTVLQCRRSVCSVHCAQRLMQAVIHDEHAQSCRSIQRVKELTMLLSRAWHDDKKATPRPSIHRAYPSQANTSIPLHCRSLAPDASRLGDRGVHCGDLGPSMAPPSFGLQIEPLAAFPGHDLDQKSGSESD